MNASHPDYTPREYPKALYGPLGTAVAKDPGHQAELEAAGWGSAPVAASPSIGSKPAPASKPVDNVALESLTKEFMALQNSYADVKAQLAQAKNDLTQAENERASLQLKLDYAPTQAKLKLQQELDTLRAQHDELKMSHRELLAVVTPPQTKDAKA